MSMRSKHSLANAAFAALLTIATSTIASGQASPTPPTAAQRQVMSERHKKMAEMHTNMAACLASDKDLTLCRQEMTDSCAANFNGNCPMMGRGKMGPRGKGMMNGNGGWDWMMMPDADTPPAAKKPGQ